MHRLLKGARPQFLTAGLALFVFGALRVILLGVPFSLARIHPGYLILLPVHLSISYSNDYFDVAVDRYGKPTFFSGMKRNNRGRRKIPRRPDNCGRCRTLKGTAETQTVGPQSTTL